MVRQKPYRLALRDTDLDCKVCDYQFSHARHVMIPLRTLHDKGFEPESISVDTFEIKGVEYDDILIALSTLYVTVGPPVGVVRALFKWGVRHGFDSGLMFSFAYDYKSMTDYMTRHKDAPAYNAMRQMRDAYKKILWARDGRGRQKW